MNRGEWGEPYTALKLLGDRRLYLADADGNRVQNEWMDILRIIRQETNDRQVTYSVNADGESIDIEINDVKKKVIKSEDFNSVAIELKNDIVKAKGRSFDVSQKVLNFLNLAEIKHMKAKSIEKSDIFLDTRDPRNSIIRKNIGFSIKCEFGENPTLFNTGKASAVKYKINGMNDSLMNQINSMYDRKNHVCVSDRCETIINNGCRLDYVGFEYAAKAKCCAFQENLDQINPRLPKVIEKMMWIHFVEKESDTDIPSITRKIVDQNPCNISLPESKYIYMIKMFLYSAYCGMTAGTLWDGKSSVKGGYITVKDTGEIVANYALESETFKSFLFNHCYLDFPSTDEAHGAYGEVYKEDGEYYFKLNFQIRIK